MKHYYFLAALTLLQLALVTCAQAASAELNHNASTQAGSPIQVLELFTSQGCHSCPPADVLLGELSEDPNHIAISCHVTYWDYLGWKDSFSQKFCDARQTQYNRQLNRSNNYTPQLVINGQIQTVGSQRSRVRNALSKALTGTELAAITLLKKQDSLIIDLEDLFKQQPNHSEMQLVIMGIGETQTIDISQGENQGKHLTYHNPLLYGHVTNFTGSDGSNQMVESLEQNPDIAQWVVLAHDKTGAIVGAGRIR